MVNNGPPQCALPLVASNMNWCISTRVHRTIAGTDVCRTSLCGSLHIVQCRQQATTATGRANVSISCAASTQRFRLYLGHHCSYDAPFLLFGGWSSGSTAMLPPSLFGAAIEWRAQERNTRTRNGRISDSKQKILYFRVALVFGQGNDNGGSIVPLFHTAGTVSLVWFNKLLVHTTKHFMFPSRWVALVIPVIIILVILVLFIL
jgi:hypothetical protein